MTDTITETSKPGQKALPALSDIAADAGTEDALPGVHRIETSPREKATPVIMDMMRSVYPHDQVFGPF